MKRNKQQKFRIKIIQELHLKKYDQKRLDDCIDEGIINYSEIYRFKSMPNLIKPFYELKRIKCKTETTINLGLKNYMGAMIYSFNTMKSIFNSLKEVNKNV